MTAASDVPPRDHVELRSMLQERMSDFAPGQQRVARLILSDPEGTALRTITQTAQLADVHQSTVVRFATLLGLKGYPSLVSLCRQHLRAEAHLISRFDKAERSSESGELLQMAMEHDRDNLVRTFTRIDPHAWQETVRALSEGPQVHIIGLRKCLPVAQLFSYLLSLVRPGVHHIAPVAGGLVDELTRMQADDVFVAISIRNYTSETVAALEYAKERGLRTIALTDSAASPLASLADHSHFVESEGVTILRSVAAFVSVVQALATEVATLSGTRSRDQLQLDETLLSRFAIYRQ